MTVKLTRPAALVSFLILVLLGGAGTPPNTLSPYVRMAERNLAEIQAARPGDAPALSPLFRPAVLNPPVPGAAAPAGSGSRTELRLLVTTGRASELRAAGFTVGTVAGDVATVTAPLSRIGELGRLPGVRRVELGLPVKPLLNLSAAEIQAVEAHGSLKPPYSVDGVTGKGVVIGIIDTGLDLTHQDFKNADGTTRIKAVWDQNDAAGPKPDGYNYGTEWTEDDINAGITREIDDVGHGTHVAGIAAGNGRASDNAATQYTYVGIAPEADILIVNSRFDTPSVVDAANWIYNRAAALGEPAVVNLSLGAQYGGHDGSYDLDRALAALSGPGRILVAAAGNEGGTGIHAKATVPAGGTVQVPFAIGIYTPEDSNNNDQVYTEAWYPTANLSFKVISPRNHTVGPQGPNTEGAQNTEDGLIYVENRPYPDSPTNYCYMDIRDQTASQPPRSGTWTVEVKNNGASAVTVDFWIPYTSLNFGLGQTAAYTTYKDNTTLVGSPASSDSVIAVGAYITKVRWNSMDGRTYEYTQDPVLGSAPSWSSPGPRRDGVLKPEIAAPGMGIASARAATAVGEFSQIEYTVTDGVHVISQGTSQAAPHVAGVVALVLQKHPTDARREVLARLKNSARSDPLTGSVPNTVFGYGKVDAKNAVSAPVPVQLASLEALWSGDRPVIRWTLAEGDLNGRFVVERGPSELGPFQAVSQADQITSVGESTFSWTDPDPDAAETWYRVAATGSDGKTDIFGPVQLLPLSARTVLWQNAPNPFGGSTTLAFSLERAQTATLEVLDLSGRRVALPASGFLSQGRHEVTWDGTDVNHRPVAAGIYFYRLITEDAVFTRRMVFLH
jgi:subtilisin family serine protease